MAVRCQDFSTNLDWDVHTPEHPRMRKSGQSEEVYRTVRHKHFHYYFFTVVSSVQTNFSLADWITIAEIGQVPTPPPFLLK